MSSFLRESDEIFRPDLMKVSIYAIIKRRTNLTLSYIQLDSNEVVPSLKQDYTAVA